MDELIGLFIEDEAANVDIYTKLFAMEGEMSRSDGVVATQQQASQKHNTGLSVLDIIKNKGKNKRRNNENRKF